MKLKLIPISQKGEPLIDVKKEKNLDDYCARHTGNFGILTGNSNNIIAIKITEPQLKFRFNFPESSYSIVCEDNVDPVSVYNFDSPGYIVFGSSNVDFTKLNFKKFMYGFELLGNGCHIPKTGDMTDDNMVYRATLPIEDLTPLNVGDVTNLFKKLSDKTDLKTDFYKRFNWIPFYRQYYRNLAPVADEIYTDGNIVVNTCGLYRVENTVGYPDDFVQEIILKPSEMKSIKEHCGAAPIFWDKNCLITEQRDGYYSVKNGKGRRITNWTAEKVEVTYSENGINMVILVKGSPPITISSDDIVSPYRINKRIARRGLFLYSKSMPMICELMSALIQFADKKHTMVQQNFIDDLE